VRAAGALCACLALWAGLPAAAQEVQRADYDTVAARLGGVMDFETFPTLPEPGQSYDGVILTPALAIGERLAGQVVTATPEGWDSLIGRPDRLRAVAGETGQNHAIAYHAGFGSNALFPLGPAGFADIAGRGEGATAVVFVSDQPALGLRIHSDYPDPLGTRPPPGEVVIRIYARDGRELARKVVALDVGRTEIAFESRTGEASMAAFSIEPRDPGGIALDDILFNVRGLSG